MAWTLPYRAAVSAFVSAVALVSTLSAPAQAATPPAATQSAATSRMPSPPRLPRDFRGQGTWIVRDLGVTVPFSWQGKDGDSQMIAGGPQYRIWFTNLIYHGSFYTVTYKWPGLTSHPCSRIPGFDLNLVNNALRGARFVGSEILQGSPDRRVNHWRVGVVVPRRPPGLYLRFPVALGDVYVDQDNRGTFWQVLQFGIQNLYDPQLDEWLQMRTFDHRPGVVTLPRRCAAIASA